MVIETIVVELAIRRRVYNQTIPGQLIPLINGVISKLDSIVRILRIIKDRWRDNSHPAENASSSPPTNIGATRADLIRLKWNSLIIPYTRSESGTPWICVPRSIARNSLWYDQISYQSIWDSVLSVILTYSEFFELGTIVAPTLGVSGHKLRPLHHRNRHQRLNYLSVSAIWIRTDLQISA